MDVMRLDFIPFKVDCKDVLYVLIPCNLYIYIYIYIYMYELRSYNLHIQAPMYLVYILPCYNIHTYSIHTSMYL